MPFLDIVVDDADPQVKYSSGWYETFDFEDYNGTFNGTNYNGTTYNGTTHFTETAGASFTFTFSGVDVTVFGTLIADDGRAGSHPNMTFFLDDEKPVLFTGIPLNGIQTTQIFYNSPDLPDAEHTLTGTCTDQGSQVYIDFFVYTTHLEKPSQSILLVTATVSATSGMSRPPDLPVGPVVGAVVGGLVLVSILLVMVFWNRRRFLKTASKPTDVAEEMEGATAPRPFTFSQLSIPSRNFPVPFDSSPSSSIDAGGSPNAPRTAANDSPLSNLNRKVIRPAATAASASVAGRLSTERGGQPPPAYS